MEILDFIMSRLSLYSIQRYLSDAKITTRRGKRIRNGKRRRRPLPWKNSSHLILFALLNVYCEILLRIFNRTGVFSDLIYPILFGLAMGMFANLLTTLFRPRTNRKITLALMLVVVVIHIVECLVHNTFSVYMTVGSMITGAGGVVTGFGKEFVAAVVTGIPAIILFFLPVVFYLLYGRRFFPVYQYKTSFAVPVLVLGLVLFGFASLVAGHGKNSDVYTDQYDFDEATSTFGLVTSLRLDVVRSGQEKEFVDVDTPKTEEPAAEPMDTEPTDGAEPVDADPVEELPQDDTMEVVEENAGENEDTPAESGDGVVQMAANVSGSNVMTIDFDKLLSENGGDIASITKYVESLEPSEKNEYTGLFKGKNFIMILAESLSDAAISKELTPTLYRLMHNGFYFSNYYHPVWGGSTSSGEYSMLTGLIPTYGVNTMQKTVGKNMYFTMGNALQREGYFNMALHNGKYQFYDRHKTHNNLGYGQWLATGNGLEKMTGRYPEDPEFFDQTFSLYAGKQPFSVYLISASGHAKYKAESKRVAKNMETVKSKITQPYEKTTLYYLCYQYQFELAMEALVNKLEENGLADDTVICFSGDHYPYGLNKSSSWGNKKSYLPDLYKADADLPWERDRNALVIWSGCLEKEYKSLAKEIKDPVYSVDITPTLLNLFGIEFDSRLLAGRDVFAENTEPLVIWKNGSFVSREGKFNAKGKKFYPNEGVTVDDDYIKVMRNKVKNKLNFSEKVLDSNYYGKLFGPDTVTDQNDRPSTIEFEAVEAPVDSGDADSDMDEDMEMDEEG